MPIIRCGGGTTLIFWWRFVLFCFSVERERGRDLMGASARERHKKKTHTHTRVRFDAL